MAPPIALRITLSGERLANYRNAGQGFLEARLIREIYIRFYRRAYATVYQQGYYLQHSRRT